MMEWFLGKKCFFCNEKLGKKYDEIRFKVPDEDMPVSRPVCAECAKDIQMLMGNHGSV